LSAPFLSTTLTSMASAMAMAMAGPGPSTTAFRERVQTHKRDKVVPGQFPPVTSLSCDLHIDEVQPPLEVIFLMGVAGYLLVRYVDGQEGDSSILI